MSQLTVLIATFAVWFASWIGAGVYYKKNSHSKPFGRGFLVGMCVAVITIIGLESLFPSHEELVKQAEQAEQEYFLLSGTSLDHGRICKAAINAFKLHQRTGNKERADLIAHGIIQDKCL